MDGMDGLAEVSFITAMSLLAVSAQFETRAAATFLLAALGWGTRLCGTTSIPRIIMGDRPTFRLCAGCHLAGNLKVTTVFALNTGSLLQLRHTRCLCC